MKTETALHLHISKFICIWPDVNVKVLFNNTWKALIIWLGPYMLKRVSYLQVKTDGHQDLVGVVSGQEGHKHILQENTTVLLFLGLFVFVNVLLI